MSFQSRSRGEYHFHERPAPSCAIALQLLLRSIHEYHSTHANTNRMRSITGALFALEVLNTMGMQYFETAVYSIGAGGFCLAVYRGLQGQSFGEIWSFAPVGLSTASEVVLGGLVGLLAGAVGIFFRT